MNTFIEKNRTWLKFYHAALRLSGWLLLTLGVCSFGITMILSRNLEVEAFAVTAINMPLGSSEFILFGLLGLGIAQLIRYLFNPDCQPGFILRHGKKFLYGYVVLILIYMVVRSIITIQYLMNSDVENAQSLFLATSMASIILFAAKALILVGIGQFLKRIMPVIEEHKSLV